MLLFRRQLLAHLSAPHVNANFIAVFAFLLRLSPRYGLKSALIRALRWACKRHSEHIPRHLDKTLKPAFRNRLPPVSNRLQCIYVTPKITISIAKSARKGDAS